jgi:uncharacterized membrane protein YgaE (UPF0421/DUF939 family)
MPRLRHGEAVSWLQRQRWLPPGLSSRTKLASKAAVAAALSWQLALLFPSSIDQYAYYGPLGAVLAMYPTVQSSLQAAGQTMLGILLGAGIALLVDLFLPTNSLTVALLVGLGVLAGALRWVGEQRAWVPITALFIFTIADPGSVAYAVGYAGLTLIGVAVGSLVNFLLFPPLHLRESRRALLALQETVAEQLEDIAEGMERNEAADPDDWSRRTRALSPTVSSMHEALFELRRSARANPRARRYRTQTDEQARQANAFQRIALLVEDLVDVLAEVEQQNVPALPLDRNARRDCADAIRRLADFARVFADGQEQEEARREAYGALERLEDSVAADPRAGGSDPFVVGTVITTLRRCLSALVTGGGTTSIERGRSRLFR